MEKIRLQKYFTDCGVLSRRAAEREIEAGHVKLNGQIAKIGDKVRIRETRPLSALKRWELVEILKH